MEVLFILVPLSIVFVLLIGMILIWAVRSGQYDDMERARYQILLDDDDTVLTGQEPEGDKRGDADHRDASTR